ncbi:MAG: hypothetical protein ACI9RU_001785 [Litorivivens sp.]|jgi:hypothetical protein
MVSHRTTFSVRVLLFTLLIAISYSAASQDEKIKPKDEEYVEVIQPLIGLRPFVQQHIDFFTIGDKEGRENSLAYRSASGLNIGGEFMFKFLRFSYQRNIPLKQPIQAGDFTPRFQQFGFGIEGRIFGMNMSYSEYSGFVLQNEKLLTDTLYSDLNAEKYRSDIRARSFNASMRWTFSKNVSAKALFEQSERQLKSAGAFTFLIAERFVKFQNDSSFVPFYERAGYSETGDMTEMWINNVQFMFGYGYVAAFGQGNWNMGLFLYTGSGPQVRQWTDDRGEHRHWKFPAVVKGRGGLGYNGKYVYTRLTAEMDYTTIGMTDSRMRWWEMFWEFSIGIRLYDPNEK